MAMALAAPNYRISDCELIGRRWAFGEMGSYPLTESLSFSQDGRIENYINPNEATWSLRDGILEIYRDTGELMWRGAGVALTGGVTAIVLNTPVSSSVQFVLIDRGPRIEKERGELSVSEFLFPRELRIAPIQVRKVLLIGSCLTALYHQEFRKFHPQVEFDYIVFNYAGTLPESPPKPASSYDCQYIQIPIRSVLTDRVIWAEHFSDQGFVDGILRDGYAVIDAMLSSALTYNISYGLLSLVSGFIVPQMSSAISLADNHTKFDMSHMVRKLNEYLASAVRTYKNAYFLDADAVASSIGKQFLLDDTVFFSTHGSLIYHNGADFSPGARIEPIPPPSGIYVSKTSEFVMAIYEQIIGALRTIRQTDQVKAVVFDLDNTLWRGQAAEHYRPGQPGWPDNAGWPMGLWEAIHWLRARGILVAICSKNDRSTIERSWDDIVQPNFLKLADFVSVKIDWRPKAENILEICKEFSIKPKSVVFVDDNPVERESVKTQIPEIRVIGSDPYSIRRLLLWAPETGIPHLTDESARREQMIRNQIVREETRATLSRDEFLQTLGSRVSFLHVQSSDAPEFGRVVELINKTNQFNTSGKRWTHAEATDFIASNGVVLAFRVKDRFADYGLVGVILARDSNIIQFVMSCRVLGMEVEQYAMAHVVGLLRARSPSDSISAFLLETPDNTPCRELFAVAGFTEIEVTNGRHLYSLRAEDAPTSPRHIVLEGV
jgi:FkbH-like protein